MSNCNESILKVYNFTEHYNPHDFINNFGPNDGILSQNEYGLTIDSNPFTIPNKNKIPNIGHDNIHYLALSTDKLKIDENKDEEVFVESIESTKVYVDKFSLQKWISKNSKLDGRIKGSDPRLACSMFNVMDLKTFISFNFIVDNKMVYACYQRLPNLKKGFYYMDHEGVTRKIEGPEYENYAAFSYAIPVYKKCKDFVKLKIGINAKYGIVNWYVNGTKVFSWNKLGNRLPDDKYLVNDNGGDNFDLKINSESSIHYGTGTFYFPDFLRFPKAKDLDGYNFVINIEDDSTREKSRLTQNDYNENYKDGLHDCYYFGISSGCKRENGKEVSLPTSKNPKHLAFKKRYLPDNTQGVVTTIEKITISSSPSSGGKPSDYPFKIKDHYFDSVVATVKIC